MCNCNTSKKPCLWPLQKEVLHPLQIILCLWDNGIPLVQAPLLGPDCPYGQQKSHKDSWEHTTHVFFLKQKQHPEGLETIHQGCFPGSDAIFIGLSLLLSYTMSLAKDQTQRWNSNLGVTCRAGRKWARTEVWHEHLQQWRRGSFLHGSLMWKANVIRRRKEKRVCFFASAGRYFWDIFSSMVRTGAGDRVAKNRHLKVKVKCKALWTGTRVSAEIKLFLLW